MPLQPRFIREHWSWRSQQKFGKHFECRTLQPPILERKSINGASICTYNVWTSCCHVLVPQTDIQLLLSVSPNFEPLLSTASQLFYCLGTFSSSVSVNKGVIGWCQRGDSILSENKHRVEPGCYVLFTMSSGWQAQAFRVGRPDWRWF